MNLNFIIKIFTISLLSSLITAQVFASTNEVTGDKAKLMFHTLSSTGLGDCGMGHCAVEVKKMKCALSGNSTGERVHACEFNDPINANTTHVKGKIAGDLFNAIVNLGLEADCGMGVCETPLINHLVCNMLGNSVGDRSYNCKWSRSDKK